MTSPHCEREWGNLEIFFSVRTSPQTWGGGGERGGEGDNIGIHQSLGEDFIKNYF
jgi:hypothetical protein